MKVLWFSNTPAKAITEISKLQNLRSTGGWLYALNDILEDELDLHVAFKHHVKINSFKISRTSYYPIYNGGKIICKIKEMFPLLARADDFVADYLHIIEKVKPDIIHIHGTEDDFIKIIDLISVPVLVSIQGNITVINHKYNSGMHGRFTREFRINSIGDLIFGPRTFSRVKLNFNRRSAIEIVDMLKIKHIIGRTDWDRRISKVFSPESKYYLGHEILRSNFYNKEWTNLYKGGKLILFTTTSDAYYKGLETIFYAIRILSDLKIDFEWRIAGITQKSLTVQTCKKFLKKNFPIENFKLMGMLDDQEIVEELLSCNMYLSASHIENSPNNLCEAMILGVPCIASFAGGTSSILKDSVEGILVQSGDPWSFAGSIIELSRNQELALKFSRNSKIKAMFRHDRNLVKKQYLDIYKQVLDKK